jgi:restriction system protein
MVLRTAKRGADAGSEFWGCTKYPACKGTRPKVSS